MNSPNMNQKVIDEDERDKINEGIKKRKEQDRNYLAELNKAEKKIVKKEMEKLPQLLENRLNEIVSVLEENLENHKGLTSTVIHKLISRRNIGLVGYSSKELFILLEAYQELINKINEKILYIPSIGSFCSFAGISSSTYKSYLNSQDEAKREAMTMIDDYIKQMLLDSSKMRKTDAATSIFVAKAEHSMTEAISPNLINYNNQVSLESVNSLIDRIKGNIIEADFTEKEK